MIKTKTIFSDIDGTLVHQVNFEDLDPFKSVALPGVVDKMVKWFDEGHHIVLTTARPEHLRKATHLEMKHLGIPFHQLVMGIGRAERILINNDSDKHPEQVRAKGIIVSKNGGFDSVNI